MIGGVFRMNSDISCGAENSIRLHPVMAMPPLDTVLSFDGTEVREGPLQFDDFDLVVVYGGVPPSFILDHQVEFQISASEFTMRYVSDLRENVPRPIVLCDVQLRDSYFMG